MADPKKPQPPEAKYESALGPIPPEHFDNDLPYMKNPDKSPGSLYDHLVQRDKPKKEEP